MVIGTIAEAAGVPPQELSPPLYDVVAPDAIEALFAECDGRTTPTTLSFEYDEFAVTVIGEADETIVDVKPLTATPAATPESE